MNINKNRILAVLSTAILLHIISLNVIASNVTGFTLINANTNVALGPLTNGTVIDLSVTPAISVEANTTGAISTVTFIFNGSNIHTEGAAPYAVSGDAAGNFNPWPVSVGTGHTLTAIPELNGTPGVSFSVNFSVVNGGGGSGSGAGTTGGGGTSGGSAGGGGSANSIAYTSPVFTCTGDFKVLVLNKIGTNADDHPSRAAGISLLQSLGASNNFTVTVDNSGAEFNSLNNLKQYAVVVFCNTAGNGLFNGLQKTNFEQYIQQGGGFVGIHAAADTYTDGTWAWYNGLVGATPRTNPKGTAQNFSGSIFLTNPNHDLVYGLPDPWTKTDEYYYWSGPGGYLDANNVNLLEVHSTGTNTYDVQRPISWYKNYNGGRSFYTALGHHSSDFINPGDPDFIDHLKAGLFWAASKDVVVCGETKKWHTQTLTFEGPYADELDAINPFMDYRMDVTFTNGTKTYVVPGYFAADGYAKESGAGGGNKWRVHFTPDEIGTWTYTVAFHYGGGIAVNSSVGVPMEPNGITGTLTITPTDKQAPDLRAKGRLEHVNERYLKFAETGEYFLKNGTDSPENFLGYYEFDNTVDNGCSQNDLATGGYADGLHHYDAHLNDWAQGDPTWNGSAGKRIIGAVNYLSSKEVNSMYFLTMNVNGDGCEVYPWTSYGERVRYDVSKLDQWDVVFSHMEQKGIAMHIVTQETENDQLLDGGSLGPQRILYYRELIARFGHHLAINWNLGEENSNSIAQLQSFLTNIYNTHPYNSFITLHTYPGEYHKYTSLLNNPHLGGTSFQIQCCSGPDINDAVFNTTNNWRVQSNNSSRKWILNADEVGPPETGLKPDGGGSNQDNRRKYHVWGSLMSGGGGSEYYFGYDGAHNDLDCENFRSRENFWNAARHANRFFQNELPFDEMNPDNSLISGGDAFCFAKPGEVYAVYLKTSNGIPTLNLQNFTNTYDVRWFNPRTGGNLQNGSVLSVTGPGNLNLGNPPGGATNNDWVVLVRDPNLIGVTGNISINNVTCNGFSDGAATVTVLTGTAPYTYAWSNGATLQNISSLAAGSYNVTVTDANGSIYTNVANVLEPVIITQIPTIISESCTGTDGAISLNVTGGTGAYTYNWSTGATTANVNNLSAGNYISTITDANGCVNTQTHIVTSTNVANYAYNETIAAETCIGSNGSVSINVSGGSAPYTYNWSTGLSTNTISNLTSGTYMVTVTDALGCSGQTSFTVPLNQAGNYTLSANIVDEGCSGNDGQIDQVLSGTGVYTYSWSNGATTEDISNINSGTYTVIITENGNCSNTQTYTVGLNSSQANFNITPSIVDETCSLNDGSITLSVAGGTAPYSYNWGGSSGTNCGAFIEQNGIVVVEVESAASQLSSKWSSQTGVPNYTGTEYFEWDHGNTWLGIDPPGMGILSYQVQINLPGTYRFLFRSASPEVSDHNDVYVRFPTNGAVSPFNYDWFKVYQNIAYNNWTYQTKGEHNGTHALIYSTFTSPGIYTIEVSGRSTQFKIDRFSLHHSTIPDATAENPLLPQSPQVNCAGSANLNNLSANNYQVVITDANGCSDTQTYTVNKDLSTGNFNVLDQIVSTGCSGTGGAIDLTVSGGQAAYTYNWSNGATTEDITNVNSGSYQVTITDASGCFTQKSYTINQGSGQGNFTASSVITDEGCGGNNGSIDFTVTGGTPPYTYLWVNGETTEDISGLTAGLYYVGYSDATGCTGSETFIVSQDTGLANFTVADVITDESCAGNDGAINLNIGGGSAPYSFNWSNGSSNQNLANLSAGTYGVVVSDANGCTNNYQFSLTLDQTTPVFSVSGAVVDQTCTGNLGSVSLNINNGSGPFTYTWSTGASGVSTLTGLSAGNYSVNVRDAMGCYSDHTYSVGVISGVGNFTVVGNVVNETCTKNDGEISVISGSGTAAYSYQWSNGATSSSASNLDAGVYSVLITDSLGCYKQEYFQISFAAGLTNFNINASASDRTCDSLNGEIILSGVNNGTAPYSYAWSNGETTSSITNLNIGDYYLMITDADGCFSLDTFNLGVIPGPGLFNVGHIVTGESCNYNDGSIYLAVSGGFRPYTYLWSNTQTGKDILNLQTGTYNVSIVDSLGCFTIQTFTVPGNGGPAIFDVFDVISNESCVTQDGTIDLTVTSGRPPYAYNWSNGQTTQDANALTAGSYSVMVTDAVGCSKTESYSISYSPSSANFIQSSTVVPEGCATNNGAIDLVISGGTAPLSYNWSNGALTKNINGLNAGTYTVTVTDANGCTEIQVFNVQFNVSAANFINNDIVVDETCNGNDASINLNIQGGSAPYIYQWNTGASSSGIANLSSGAYSVTITDQNGCFDEFNYTIGVLPGNGSFTVNPVIVNEHCNGNLGSINLNTTGGISTNYTYQWSNGSNNNVLLNISSGVYTVTVSDQYGCTQMIPYTITKTPGWGTFGTSVQIANESCNSNDGFINASVHNGIGPYMYNWSNGNTTEDIYNLSTGIYTLTVTDQFGCFRKRTTTLGFNAGLASLPLSNTIVDETCVFNDGSIVSVASNGIAPYTYLWSIGSSSNSITAIASGIYELTVTDSRGCYANHAIHLPFVPGPGNFQINPFSIDEKCEDANGAINLTPTGGYAPYTYNWSNGASTALANGLTAGTYQVTVTDNKGCYIDQSISVVAVPLSPAPAITLLNDTLYSSPAITYQWNFNGNPVAGATSISHPANQSGVYSVNVTDSLGCELTSDTISVLLTGIENFDVNSQISVWPNPATDYLSFELTMSETHHVELLIENILGQKLFYNEIGKVNSLQNNIQVTNYEDGIYFITFIIDNKMFTKKFIKN